VGGHVSIREEAVLLLEEHLAAGSDEDRAERVVPVRDGAPRHLEGPAQEARVVVVVAMTIHRHLSPGASP
jgi:hypothetical protein